MNLYFSDRWGGIWEAPRSYTFTAEDNKQTGVELVKKFDNWAYANNGIEQRMPWISGARLTTSESALYKWEGTITGACHEKLTFIDNPFFAHIPRCPCITCLKLAKPFLCWGR